MTANTKVPIQTAARNAVKATTQGLDWSRATSIPREVIEELMVLAFMRGSTYQVEQYAGAPADQQLPPELDFAGKSHMQQRARDRGGHLTFGNMSDEWVADRVRMLMRKDLHHEAICVAARDRIMLLSMLAEQLRRALARIYLGTDDVAPPLRSFGVGQCRAIAHEALLQMSSSLPQHRRAAPLWSGDPPGSLVTTPPKDPFKP